MRPRRRGRRPRRRGGRRSTPAPTRRWSARTSATTAAAARRAAASRCARIDDAVRRILRVKFRAGLFDHPYVDPAKAEAAQLRPDAVAGRAQGRAAARWCCSRTTAATLPLDPAKTTAVIGPLGDNQHDMLGPWWGRGDDEDAVSVSTASRRRARTRRSPQGCTISNKEPPDNDAGRRVRLRRRLRRRRRGREGGRPGRARARRVARAMSGEAAVAQRHRPAGQAAGADRRDQGDRQAVRRRAVQRPPAHARRRSPPPRRRSSRPGSRASQAGNAVADVLFGKVNPGGKLPVVVPAPRRPGADLLQPRADRPAVRRRRRSTTRATATCRRATPLYPFGYGLSYTTFEVSNLRAEPRRACRANGQRDRASVDVDQHRRAARATRSCSSTSTTRSRASRSRCAACAASSGSRSSRASSRLSRSRSTRATSASTTTAASSSSSRAGSTCTPATAQAGLTSRCTVTG